MSIVKETMVWITFVLAFGAFALTLNKYFSEEKPLTLKTISVAKILESELGNIDEEMKSTNTTLSPRQIREKTQAISEKISNTLTDYSTKHKVVILEKSAIVSDGVGIEDITDDFLRAIK